jgi:hypothetical protein
MMTRVKPVLAILYHVESSSSVDRYPSRQGAQRRSDPDEFSEANERAMFQGRLVSIVVPVFADNWPMLLVVPAILILVFALALVTARVDRTRHALAERRSPGRHLSGESADVVPVPVVVDPSPAAVE